VSKSDRVAPAPAPTTPKVEPLKPRRGVFIALCVLMALWIACLIGMYFTTVRKTH
jgi:hypothetical protein